MGTVGVAAYWWGLDRCVDYVFPSTRRHDTGREKVDIFIHSRFSARSKKCFTGRTIVFFRIHSALMLAGIVGPTTASLLMAYNVWLPWVLGEVLTFVAVLLTLLLPNRKDERDPKIGLNDDHGTMVHDDSTVAVKHTGISMTERVVAALQRLRTIRTLLTANAQVLLLLIMTGLSNLGNESLALLLLLYVPERYHWTFAKVMSLQPIHSFSLCPLTPYLLLGWLPMVS